MPPPNSQPTRLSDEQRHILSLLASGENDLAQQLAKAIGWDMQAAFQLEFPIGKMAKTLLEMRIYQRHTQL